MSEQDAYYEGFDAYFEGLDLSQCPYPCESPHGKEWTAGFQDASDPRPYEEDEDEDEEEDDSW